MSQLEAAARAHDAACRNLAIILAEIREHATPAMLDRIDWPGAMDCLGELDGRGAITDDDWRRLDPGWES